MTIHVKRYALFLLLCVVSLRADHRTDEAVKRLSGVKMFAFGGVGYAGVTSKGEIDFKLLISQPAEIALAKFEKLYATGNPQGRSYALAGIKKLNPDRFKQLLEAIRASKDQVEVMRGCIVSHELLRDVGKQIDGGKFRF